MFLGLGIDIELIESLKQKKALHNSNAFFNKSELLYCQNKIESFVALICVKESFIKAVESINQCPRYSYKDIELVHHSSGKPYLKLHGELSIFFKLNELISEISISHTREAALAVVAIYKGREW